MERPDFEALVNFSERSSRPNLLSQTASFVGEYDVTFTPVRPARSGRQNRYFHGPICGAWTKYNREQGVLVTTHQAKELFKVVACGEVDRSVDPATGELLAETFRSTANYTVSEMSGFIERCIVWLAERRIYVPPTELYGFSLEHAEPAAK